MKAIVINQFGGKEALSYQHVDKPSIVGSNEVLISVVATSVNYADIQTREGRYHAAGKPPIIPGLDAAGVVESVGAAVRTVSVGDRVVAFPKTGSYAEYCIADEELVFALPPGIGFEEAAASPIVSFTSYALIAKVARMQKGEAVLIHAAAGGIGTTATQIAKILGAGCVIGTVGHESKRQAALESGADYVICYETEDFVQKVNELTGNKGADVILDSIAGKIGEQSLDCLAPYGRLVNFGNASGEPAQFQTKDLHSTCRSILGFSIGTTKNQRPHMLHELGENVFRYLSTGQLNIKISNTFNLPDAGLAQQLVESRQSTGKVVLKIS
ncbi:quinone oxidoreductase family protein [Halalkalibacter oceani]|uniref:quinone oxidoreductase family protein n=1 Tax=Halalkalibacter oceani TaxID=1653776 RepID=UPI003392E752